MDCVSSWDSNYLPKDKMLYLIMGLSILLMISYSFSKIGSFPLFCGLVFMYWIPLDSRLQIFSTSLSEVYPTELGVWMLCMGILIHRSVSPSAQWNSTVSRFPLLPFLLFIGSALITCLISESYYGTLYALVRIRNFCLLPALLCFLCIYLIKTVKQAEYLLWIFLISAGVVALVFLYGPKVTTMMEYVGLEEGGRVRTAIKIPLFSAIEMSSETIPVCFAFIIALSFNLWLNHPSFWGRSMAGGILVISAFVILQAQGRTGLIAAGCSVLIIAALSLRFKKYSFSSFSKSLLKVGIIILLLFGGFWYYASILTHQGIQLRGMTFLTHPFYALRLADRIYRWKGALNVILHHPFGVGVYGFHLSPYGDAWHAHSLILYLLLSFGIIGFVGFFWIFVRYIKACWSGLHSDNLDRRILCILGIGHITALFVAMVPSCICWYPFEVLMVWIPVGITMAAATLKDKDEAK